MVHGGGRRRRRGAGMMSDEELPSDETLLRYYGSSTLLLCVAAVVVRLAAVITTGRGTATSPRSSHPAAQGRRPHRQLPKALRKLYDAAGVEPYEAGGGAGRGLRCRVGGCAGGLRGGRTLWEELPYAAVLSSALWGSHCHACFGVLPSVAAGGAQRQHLTCRGGCRWVRYCSTVCRDRDAAHSRECHWLQQQRGRVGEENAVLEVTLLLNRAARRQHMAVQDGPRWRVAAEATGQGGAAAGSGGEFAEQGMRHLHSESIGGTLRREILGHLAWMQGLLGVAAPANHDNWVRFFGQYVANGFAMHTGVQWGTGTPRRDGPSALGASRAFPSWNRFHID
eukprot:COSAG01_NODE_959_length_12451_cov_18.389815_15_plen_338_part_00